MSKRDKFIERFMSGQSDADISFDALCFVLKRFGFQVRVRGNHHIFTKDGVPEIINLQPVNAKAKPYQVRQVRSLLRAFGWTRIENESRPISNDYLLER